MIRAATFALRGTRTAPLVYLFQFRGTDLTGASIVAQVRQQPDAPGDPEFNLALGGTGSTTGLRLISVTTVDGQPVSTLELVVSQADMASVPVNVETLGEVLRWSWDLQVTPAGGVKARWVEGAFEIGGGVTRSSAGGGSGSTGVDAVFSIVSQTVQVSVQGEALYAASLNAIEGLRDQATAAADAAETSAGTALAASGVTYSSISAGLAATVNGQTFAVNPGTGIVTVYLKSGGVAVEQRPLPTPAWVEGQLAPLLGADLGTLPAGSSQALVVDRAFTGAADGSTVAYGEVHRLEAKGANPITQARTSYQGLDITATGGVTVATGEHRYVWNKGSANVQYVRVFEGHVRNDGPGTISQAFVFNTVGITAGGPVTEIVGYSAGTLGDATQVQRAYGFNVGDQPQCAEVAIGFRSEMTAGAVGKKFAFRAVGDAPSAFGGKVMIGDTAEAAHALHVKDNRADFAARIENAHPSTPWGVRVYFTGAAANNTTQEFVRCEDSATRRFAVYSNGNLVNSNNSYGAISDAKLKRDIEDAGDQVADIRAFRLRRYRLIAEGENGPWYLGGIAQEVEEFSPGLVFTTPDIERYFEPAFERGGIGEPDQIPLIGQGEWKERPAGTVTKNLNYSVLCLKAIGALQTALDRIDALEALLAQTRETMGITAGGSGEQGGQG